MALSVPQPQLAAAGVAGTAFPAEKPITLSCGPVTLPDGSLLAPSTPGLSATFLVGRRTAGGLSELWNDGARLWVPPVPVPPAQGLFPAQAPGSAGRWQALILAIGQQDAAGAPKLATDPVSGFPTYFVRCVFSGRDGAGQVQVGTSPDSPPVTVLAPGQSDRAGLAIDTPTPQTATRIQVFLRDPATGQAALAMALHPQGFLVELVANGAAVQLTEQGGIRLVPAPGRPVTVEGTLDVRDAVLISGVQVNAP